MRRRLTMAVLAAAVFVAAVTLVSAVMPARWHAEASTEIGAGVDEVVPWVDGALGWSRWLGWEADLDASLQWTPTQGAVGWSGTRLGRGGLAGAPTATLTWAVTVAPEQGVAWQGTLALEPGASGCRATWTNSGDYGRLPWTRLAGSQVANMARDRMQRSLSRLERLVETTLARRAREVEAARAAAAADAASERRVAEENARVRGDGGE